MGIRNAFLGTFNSGQLSRRQNPESRHRLIRNEPLTVLDDHNPQGQRELSMYPSKDLQQVVDAPSCHATLHDVAFLARMLLDETQCEPAKP